MHHSELWDFTYFGSWSPDAPQLNLLTVFCFIVAPCRKSARRSRLVSCSNCLVLPFLWLLVPRRHSAFPEFSHSLVRASNFVRSPLSPTPAGICLEHPSRLPYSRSWNHLLQSPIPFHVSLPILPACSSLPALAVFPFWVPPLHSTGEPCWLSRPIKLPHALDAWCLPQHPKICGQSNLKWPSRLQKKHVDLSFAINPLMKLS